MRGDRRRIRDKMDEIKGGREGGVCGAPGVFDLMDLVNQCVSLPLRLLPHLPCGLLPVD